MNAPRLKVMHVLGAKNSGGAELFYLRLVIALQKHCEVLCVVRENSWMAKQLEEKGIPYRTAPFGGLLDFKTKTLLKKYMNNFKPDVVQGWMNRACKAFPKTKIPTVGRLGGYYALKNYKNCDYLAGNTKGIQNYLIQSGWPEDKSFYLPNFSPLPPSEYREHRSGVRYGYQIPQSAKVLFVAGRLHDVKGIDTAITALKDLPVNVYLLVAGTGPEESALRSLAESLDVADRVHFAGWVSELSVVASAADIWLVPSRYEPLGNVVLDAWAHEIPLVTADAAGPKSLVEDGVSGVMVPMNDPDALVKGIARVLDDETLAQKIVEGGTLKLKNTFSEEVVVAQYLAFYRQISLNVS
tara:strand:- start:51043 stop:52104 length:1062 start_codon:yes stop_codon:yes gene_type:complete